jgi:hypothetical protein
MRSALNEEALSEEELDLWLTDSSKFFETKLSGDIKYL